MMNFNEVLKQYSWQSMEKRISEVKPEQVGKALRRVGEGRIEDFLALVSPAAEEFLPEMGELSYANTRKRFGNNINLFAPIYLSNECNNICTYCGFSYNNPSERKTLKREEIEREIETLKKSGFDSVLILTGENSKNVGLEYFKEALPIFRKNFSYVSIEVQPLLEEEYKVLLDLGLDGVLVYQETYHRENYKLYHPRGKKSNFEYRLATPERVGRGRARKIGLGVLLGLENWRVDSFFCALHLDFLKRKYWQSQYSISFPRLRPASGVSSEYNYVSEKNLLQLILAYRLFDEDLDLSLSTRESPTFRDKVIPYGITTISAGSKTNPGGYACYPETLKQFEISDERSVAEISQMLQKQNLEPVWKDGDRELNRDLAF